jgi:uncharacterized protein (TIGR02266 family)
LGRTNPDGTETPDVTERRSAERVPIDAEITLASDSQFFTSLGGNLSTGGVFVATYRKLPVGCGVAVHIALPDGELVAKGTVRWVRDVSTGAAPGLGIAFERIGSDDAGRIASFCANRAPLLHDDD